MAKEKKELTCPECGQTGFGSAAGLRGHRQFKHGVPPSGPQLPLEQQDRLITESVLGQRIEESLGEVIEQVGSEMSTIKQQLKQLAERQPDSALATKVDGLEQRLRQAEAKFDYKADVGTVLRLEEVVMSLQHEKVVKQEEDTPEPPYLHIIDHEAPGYFPWTEGRWAKIIEA